MLLQVHRILLTGRPFIFILTDGHEDAESGMSEIRSF